MKNIQNIPNLIKMKNLTLVLLVIFNFLNSKSNATHIYQAFVEVDWLSEDSLMITEYIFSDCNSVSFKFGQLYITSPSTSIKYVQDYSKRVSIDATPLCSKSCRPCQGNPSCSFGYGIEMHTRYTILPLKRYYNKQDCLLSIEHFFNPVSTFSNVALIVQETYSVLNICKGKNIELPKWKRQEQQPIMCQGDPIRLDIGMTDMPKLNTNYSLEKLYKSSKFKGLFRYETPITFQGFPKVGLPFPQGFHLNKKSGSLSFKPMRVEQSVVNIKGVVTKGSDTIWTNNRLLSLLVIKCPTNSPPQISNGDCKGVSNKVIDIIACAKNPNSFRICTSDPNRDAVKIKFHNNVPGLSLQIEDTTDKNQALIGTFTPDTSIKSTQEYSFMVTAIDNKCPIPRRATEEYKIHVYNDTSLDLSMSIEKMNVCGRYKMEVLDKDSMYLGDRNVTWLVNDTIPLDTGNLIRPIFKKAGKYKISATYAFCDTITLVDSIEVKEDNLEANLMEDADLCSSDEFSFDISPTSGSGIKSTEWTIDNKLVNKTGRRDSSGISLAFPNATGIEKYHIGYRVEDSFGCVITSQAELTVRNFREQNILNDITFCTRKDTLISLPAYQGNSNWTGLGVDTSGRWFDSKLSNETSNLLTYLNKDSGYCIIDSTILTIFKENSVTAGDDFSVCLGHSDSLLAGTPPGGDWTGNGVISNNVFKPVLAQLGKHELIYTYENAIGCKFSDTLEVEVVKSNQVSITAPTGVCVAGDSVSILALPAGGAWASSSFVAHSNSIRINPRDFSVGKHNFRYFFANSTGCPSSDTLEFTIGDFPQISISGLEDRCQNAAKFELNGFPARGTWTGTGTAVGSAYEVEPSQLSVGKNTYHYATQNEYCAGDTTVSLTILASPEADFSQSASKLMQGDSLYLTNLSTEINNSSYDWSISGPTTYSSQDENPLIISKVKGIYDIRLSITDEANKCTDILVKKASLEIEQNTGVNNANANKVTLYPNPVGNELTIDNKSGQNLQIEIIGLDGKTLWIGSSSEAKTQIDFSLFPTGIYQVIILGADLFKTQKVVKS